MRVPEAYLTGQKLAQGRSLKGLSEWKTIKNIREVWNKQISIKETNQMRTK